jgi:hypothetical protein
MIRLRTNIRCDLLKQCLHRLVQQDFVTTIGYIYMCFIDRRKYEHCVIAQNMPCSIVVIEYELSIFIC